MGENNDIPLAGLNSGYHPINTLRHLIERLSIRTRVSPDRPTGHLVANLVCGKPLVVTVIPFHQVFLGLQSRAKPCDVRGFQRSFKWATDDVGEFYLIENRPKKSSLFSPRVRQLDIGATRVPAILRPFGLTVADQIDLAVSVHGGRLPVGR